MVKRLPKTRSGKILRGTMRKIADGEEYKVPSTIDDPVILGEIEDALRHRLRHPPLPITPPPIRLRPRNSNRKPPATPRAASGPALGNSFEIQHRPNTS